MRVFRIVALCLACSAARLVGQGTGSFYGTVTDSGGGVIVGAVVTAISAERGTTRDVKSNGRGEWVLSLLPAGEYNMRVEAGGFKSFVRNGLSLESDQNVKVDAGLEMGSSADSVTITAEAPLVDSRTSTLGATLDSKQLVDLPLNGRNIFELTTLLPGVSSVTAPETFTNDRKGPTFTTSGSRTADNQTLLDGILYTALFRNTGLNYPPPDAIQEVHVLTSNFAAEYGRSSGTTLNVVTRSGTNTLHGSAWEFVRNNAFNARTFFAKTTTKLVKNQYGGTLGGPIVRNKLFLFGSYQGLKVRPATLVSSAKPPTAAESAGNFGGKLTDPLTNMAFPNGIIPVSRFDPVAVRLNQLIAPGNQANGQLVTTYSNPQNDDQGLIRGDYYWGKHAIDGRFNHDVSNDQASSGNVPSYERVGDFSTVNTISLGDTVALTPNMINVIRVAYNRFSNGTDVLTPYSLHSLGSNLPQYGPATPSEINVTGRFDVGNTSAAPATLVNSSEQATEALTWTRGTHTFKLGAEYLRLQYLNRTFFQSQGGFTFTGIFTGNPLADFLLGFPATLNISTPALEQAAIQHNGFFYAQDDWRVTRRLTLNLGLRYELSFPYYHPNDYWGSFMPGVQSTKFPTAPRGLIFPGDPGIPRGLVQTDLNNFAPRFGFAWDVFGDGKTAVRGGYGIYYNAISANIVQNGTQPYRYSFTINAPYNLTDPLRGQAPIPAFVDLHNPQFSGVPQLNYPDPSLRTPYTQQYNVTVQREVASGLLLEAAYVGKLGRKLLAAISSNPGAYQPGLTASQEQASLNQRRIYQGFGDLTKMGTFANSEYNALQTRVVKRYAHRFLAQGTYTYSKSLDQFSTSVTDTAIFPDPNNINYNWGLSDFSARHIASAALVYDSPSFAGRNHLLREAAGAWNISGRFTARSGLPINPITGQDNAFSGTPQQRPDVNGSPNLPSGRPLSQQLAEWFNPAVFTLPAAGRYGSSGRNVILGPGQYSPNVALLKNFPLGLREGMQLQFRAEAFSVLNHPIFGQPNNSLSGGTMGRITSASGDRQLQFALKLSF